MSSESNATTLSPTQIQMIQSVLGNAGYVCVVPADHPQRFNPAELLLNRLVRAGETSPRALALQLEYNFGKPSGATISPYRSYSSRYAIQGLPNVLRKLKRAATNAVMVKSNDAAIQGWENEGGSVSSKSAVPKVRDLPPVKDG